MKTELGTNVNRKLVIGVYLKQCQFFKQQPLYPNQLKEMTARQIYHRGAALLAEQPMIMQEAFTATLRGESYTFPVLTKWQRFKKWMGFNVYN